MLSEKPSNPENESPESQNPQPNKKEAGPTAPNPQIHPNPRPSQPRSPQTLNLQTAKPCIFNAVLTANDALLTHHSAGAMRVVIEVNSSASAAKLKVLDLGLRMFMTTLMVMMINYDDCADGGSDVRKSCARYQRIPLLLTMVLF